MFKLKRYLTVASCLAVIICLSVTLGALLSASANAAAANGIVPDSILKHWGYRNHSLKYPLDYCEVSVPHRTQRQAQSIRSLNAVKGEAPHTYYRFTLIKEDFDSEQAAQQRLAAMKAPRHHSIRYSKTCDLIDGFATGNQLYLIHTDVYLFSFKEQPRLLKLLRRYVLNKPT